MTENQAAVFAVLRAIPYGHLCSYGEVARRAGLPGAARLVARMLSSLPDAGLPWWRVVRSDGRQGLDPESNSGIVQRERLREEGVVMQGNRYRGPWW